ncbi:MAG: cytochrome c [Planctomycetota bacterium]
MGQSVEQGQALYQSSCVACHGADAKGRPGLGKDMTDSAFLRETSDDDLVDFLRDGRPVSHPDNTTGVPMPPRGGNPSLSDADLRSIVLYLRGFTVPR